ncbi:unnamed protein product [Rangifer tarandus platyrhynchus]|uniref:Uncharacterized protein n=2 Tax=Rangifer tarandus platyrhynchus TaxID=3082113 RepID=A0ACB0DPY7_RANTA|nr:unnamed protein product [Rangifer tarandus platyrhynchus]CAI9690320.1 unnamed protein product [Rangifer tarandus platyrhynchus]
MPSSPPPETLAGTLSRVRSSKLEECPPPKAWPRLESGLGPRAKARGRVRSGRQMSRWAPPAPPPLRPASISRHWTRAFVRPVRLWFGRAPS